MNGIDESGENAVNEMMNALYEKPHGRIPAIKGIDLDALELKPHELKIGDSLILGAITGDIIGSVYEFHNVKRKDFDLFTPRTKFTDDSILTVATMEALLSGETASADYMRLYQSYGRQYPNRGWGGRFHYWIHSDDPKPYGSWGNGSAMRVSPIGWVFDSIEEVLTEAEKSASVSHNHSEGIKGAQAAALAVWLARNGVSKKDIKWNIRDRFGYNLERTCDEIREDYSFDESCQGTVPEAVIAFLESANYEDAIRLAISLGGDSDTLACITGGIAEAYYGGLPAHIAVKALAFLPPELIRVIARFSGKYRSKMKSQIEKGERYAAKGVEYLSRKLYWEAADEFTAALEFISGVMGKTVEEKRIEWLCLRGDARHGRQWFEDALADYKQVLSLRPFMAEIAEKIEAVISEGRNFNPYIGETQ
jgi:ADP-ribosylglycohydrolase